MGCAIAEAGKRGKQSGLEMPFWPPLPPRLDGRDLVGILRLQVDAAFKDFERVFLIRQAKRISLGLPGKQDVGRGGAPCSPVGLLPVKKRADATATQGGT